MIVYKKWRRRHSFGYYLWHGWFLFGLVPIYLKREGVEAP